jgi:hypothetical protein
VAVDKVDAEETGGEPEDCGEEGERNICLPLLALVVAGCEVAPVKDGAAVEGADELCCVSFISQIN